MEDQTPELFRILYVDGDFAQHDTRRNGLENTIPEIRVITAETANDAISKVTEDVKSEIIAIILSQTLGKKDVQKVLHHLQTTDREEIERFLITTGSKTVSEDLIQQLEEENTDPGMAIAGRKGPYDIAEAVKQKLIGAGLILNVENPDPRTFDPSRTEPMIRPDFKDPTPKL